MKAPESLATLLENGIIQDVVRPLMSGKEAQVYVVMAGGQECVAKVYKEATQRTFKHRSSYTEGRRTRNTRDQRAMSKRTQHGRQKDEDAWRATEVEMIYRLRDAGVRVPEPINFVDGVLVMELVKDADGHPAPRLGDLTFSPAEADAIYRQLIREVVRMLCAGVIHGDLSDFNVLMAVDGPVVIDFPQSIDPARNPNGKELLLRDVENLHRFLARFAPGKKIRRYGEEIWSLFQENRLEPDMKLNGLYKAPRGKANTDEVIALIEDARREEGRRRGDRETDEADDLVPATPLRAKAPAAFRTVVDVAKKTKARVAAERRPGEATPADGAKPAGPRRRRGRGRGRARVRSDAQQKPEGPKTAKAPAAAGEEAAGAGDKAKAKTGAGRPRRRRRRRSRKASAPE